MNLKQAYQMMIQTQTLLINTATHTEEYLNGYDATVDWLYMVKKYGTLKADFDNVEDLNMLVDVAFKLNNYKWSKLYATTQLEYNPIWNVDGTTTTTEIRGGRHETNSYGQDHATTGNAIAPFDSSTPRPTDTSDTTRDAREDEYTADTYTDTTTETRGGNIGVTSTQKLIGEEREVSDFSMLDVIMTDIINMITLPYFEED